MAISIVGNKLDYYNNNCRLVTLC